MIFFLLVDYSGRDGLRLTMLRDSAVPTGWDALLPAEMAIHFGLSSFVGDSQSTRSVRVY
jgi:hypothetical protein